MAKKSNSLLLTAEILVLALIATAFLAPVFVSATQSQSNVTKTRVV
jgi:hypothetical protein